MMEEKYDITHSFSHMRTEEEVREQITDRTTCVFIETPINPTMRVIDLEIVAKAAKEYGVPVVVDNTFCTPYLQRPLEKGCDIVIHSATKYISGHGDVIAGLVVGDEEFMNRLRMSEQKDIGGVLSPFDAWLLLRGLKTLHVRMDRHSSNAQVIADKLASHPRVERVYYPGVREIDSPAGRQMRNGGGVVAFELSGGKREAQNFIDRLSFIRIAVSLGDAETLIQHPASMTHAVVPAHKREEMGITDSLIRLSVGLEAADDIWHDIYQALSV